MVTKDIEYSIVNEWRTYYVCVLGGKEHFYRYGGIPPYNLLGGYGYENEPLHKKLNKNARRRSKLERILK